MEYYSAIKNDGIMPFSAIWMELEVIILSKVHQIERQISYDSTSTSNLKKDDTNEFIYTTETDSQTQKTNLCLPKGKGGGIN